MPKSSGSKPARRGAARNKTTRQTAPRRAPARKSARNRVGKKVAAAAAATIQGWPTDPMGGSPPLQLPAPALPGSPLPTRIIDPAQAPPAQVHPVGTPGFRYWTAAESLRRCASFWSAAGAQAWHPDIGPSLPVRLDDGVDLNAYYARNDFPPEDIKQGLSFFHDTVREATGNRQLTVFSGESPDVASHELGHAVLDTLKPVLFEIASIEAAAFHESFGDMSAILTALQLPSVRQAVLEQTDGNLRRNSSVSRVAEQLGFAIRQRSPAAVDADCLRNAANAFLYVDPLTLPSSGPASQLTRAPHNFSRVFTGAFLESLGGMVLRLAARPGADDVLQASTDMGRLLARAIVAAPVSTRFFQAVVEQIVLADSALFAGKYSEALTSAFVRRNLLPVSSLATPAAMAAPRARAAAAAARHSAAAGGRGPGSGPVSEVPLRVAIDGAALGLGAKTLYVSAPPVDDAGTAPASMMAGVTARAATGAPRTADVQAFCESLIVRGRVSMSRTADRRRGGLVARFAEARRHATHYLDQGPDDSVELKRIAFECC
jgi:hypothetical protein